MRTWVSIGALILFALGVGYFVSANQQEVSVYVLGKEFKDTRLWVALLSSLLLGASLTLAACSWPLARLKISARRDRKRIGELEQEVHGLRTLPIASDAASSSSAQKV